MVNYYLPHFEADLKHTTSSIFLKLYYVIRNTVSFSTLNVKNTKMLSSGS